MRTLVTLAASMLAAGASAQTTGAISGRIVDAQGGAPLGDAVLSVSGPALQGEETARTDASGRFALGLLPPGAYALNVERDGYVSFTREELHVDAGRTLFLPLSMHRLGVPAAVEVPAPLSAIGISSISRQQMELIPYGRDLRTFEQPAIAFAGIDESFAAYGSPSTLYLDGIRTSSRLLQHFVEQVDVKTASYAAEYGRSRGGIISGVTRSGGDEFHGSLFGDFLPVELPRRSLRYDLDGGFELGGPLQRQKLWFYGGVAPAHVELRPGAQTDFQYVGKLTWTPLPGQTLVASGIDDNASLHYLGRFLQGSTLVDALGAWNDPQGAQGVAKIAHLFGAHAIKYGVDLARGRSAAGFAQDTLRILDALVLDAGGRVEDGNFMPRAGLAYDFLGGGLSRAYAFYGRFPYDQYAAGVQAQMLRDTVLGIDYIHKFFRPGLYDAATISLARPFAQSWLVQASYTYAARDQGVALKLTSAYAYEWTPRTTFTLGESLHVIDTALLDVRAGISHALSSAYLLTIAADAMDVLSRTSTHGRLLARLSF